jgi:hypothetical protein
MQQKALICLYYNSKFSWLPQFMTMLLSLLPTHQPVVSSVLNTLQPHGTTLVANNLNNFATRELGNPSFASIPYRVGNTFRTWILDTSNRTPVQVCADVFTKVEPKLKTDAFTSYTAYAPGTPYVTVYSGGYSRSHWPALAQWILGKGKLVDIGGRPPEPLVSFSCDRSSWLPTPR